jgi:hypothetical protein
LQKQQHGALEKGLEYIYEQILMKSSTTDWGLIAGIYPMPSVISRVNKQTLLNLWERWVLLQIPVAEFLEEQWESGVYECAERAMMVPPR